MGWALSFENLQSGRRRRHHCGGQHNQQRERELLVGPYAVADTSLVDE
jgi:hypothetical protein